MLLRDAVTQFTYSELLEKQAEIVQQIEETGVYKIFSYQDAFSYFLEVILLPKKQGRSQKIKNIMHDPLLDFAKNNADLIAQCYIDAIAKNSKTEMWKAGFGATFEVALAPEKPAITLKKPKTGEECVLPKGLVKLECRFFATPI